jgi:hypothetical protein
LPTGSPYTLFEHRNFVRTHIRNHRTNARCQQTGGPEVLKVGKCSVDCNLLRFDRIKARSCPHLPQNVHLAYFGVRRQYGIETHGAHFGLHRFQRKSAAEHIPHIRGHRTARANHSHHLGNRLLRIGNEENH